MSGTAPYCKQRTEEWMKTGIIGAGSIGSLFSWYFSRAGIDTVIYEKSDETVSAISSGLTISTIEGDSLINPVISGDPSVLSDADIIFLFVKSYSTAEAVNSVAGIIRPDSIIVSLQNGLGNYENITRYISAGRVVYGTTTFGAAKISPAKVVFGGKGTVNIGGADSSAVQKVHKLISESEIDVYISDNPERIVWLKALINAGINPVASILGIKNGEILENNNALELQELILEEAVAAARFRGNSFEYENILRETRVICGRTALNTCSMLQDLRACRKTEIESINMKITEYGEAAGLDMKCNRTVSLIIRAMEEKNIKEGNME